MAKQLAAFVAVVLLVLVLSSVAVFSDTFPSDIQGLRSLRHGVDPTSIPSYSYLHTWDFSLDPCAGTGNGKFLGVLCNFPLDNSSTRVVEVQLDDAGYEGFLSPSIGNLSEITVFSLSKNKFRGLIPESISNLRKLTRLSLSENFFTGNIPVTITWLRELRIIDLSKNILTGEIPEKFSSLRRLTRLNLANNHLGGRIPALNGLWKLEALELDRNHFLGSLPKLPISLRTLSVSHNGLTGHILPLHRLKQLESLDLSDNRLSGTISHEILTFPEIVSVNISFNQFTSMKVIKFTDRESQLKVLDAEGNHLEGRLPINLVTYESLREINLRNNKYFGIIPKTYGRKLDNPWRSLYLDKNYLNGELPQQFRKLTRQIRGSLAHNCLNCPKNVELCRGGQKPKSQCTNSSAGF